MVRTPSCDQNGLTKGTWTPEEDRKLIAYVTRYGCWNWRQLPKYAGLSRCGKSCRLRWMNYLRPNIKRGNYSQEEQDLILKLHESLGNRWSAIAAHLPGRTDNEVKNYWHTYIKKRSKQNSISREPKINSKNPSLGGRSQEIKRSKRKNSSASNHRIIESSPLSPQQVSSESSSSNTDSSVLNCPGYVVKDDVSIFAEPGGDFWTEPFLEDNYNTTNDFLPPVVDYGLLYPPSPFMGEEILYSDGLNYDHNDSLIWQYQPL